MTQLVLSHFSVRHASFTERVAAAAENGFAGIGLYVNEYARLRDSGHSDADLRAVLHEHGVQVFEYEAVHGWSASGAAYAEYERRMDLVDRMADAFGPPHHVQVVGPYVGTVDEGAEAFGRLCDRLAPRGIRAALEYLPVMTNIPDAASAWDFVQRAGRDNGGLCVDSWHHHRSGETWESLASVPADRVVSVQFDDGPPEQVDPDYKIDCMSNRLLPGEGAFDLVGFVRTLDAMGVTAPYEVEVVSLELDAHPVHDVVRRMAESTRAVLAAARA
ncbi:sugar phosphate isomerase/epimerase family protein [Jatrophihabitans fulvus]